ncbi:MAG: threonine aldolase [Gaiellales bacterium]|jgi:threonine aldolase|nr:threonine aldolase [Gaiellales bacterium]
MPPIDLRSDTVTRPTQEMRKAMADAEVGDDVWGDDPTVIALEQEVAALLGKEAALYVPSGTMGNQLGIRSQTHPGDEILVHELAHVIVHESGGPALLSGVQARMIAGERGMPGPEGLERWLRDPDDIHHAPQSLVCIENTIGEQGGLVYPLERIDAVCGFAHERGLRVHMDGARLWNAAVASGDPPARILRDVDSVSVCFSKGLGAPVGSALVGDAALIERARRGRKLLGGGMRQAGIIAAGALYALRHHVDRLAEDHAVARLLAEGLEGGRRLAFDPSQVETNLVFARLADGENAVALVGELEAAGVLCAAMDTRTIRFVTHLDAPEAAVREAVRRIGPLLA